MSDTERAMKQIHQHVVLFYMKPCDKCSLMRCVVTANRLAQLVECRTTVWEVVGSNPSRSNTRSFKITEEKVLPF